MKHDRLLRVVTVLLLALITLDLTGVDTCAFDFDLRPAASRASAPSLLAPGAGSHPHAVLHPDHCFCQGLSTGPDWSIGLTEPARDEGAVTEIPSAHLLRAATVLDHPPQSAA